MNKEMQQAKNNCSTPADADSVPLVLHVDRSMEAIEIKERSETNTKGWILGDGSLQSLTTIQYFT